MPSASLPRGSVVRSMSIVPGQRVGHDQRRRRQVVQPARRGASAPRSCGCPRAPRRRRGRRLTTASLDGGEQRPGIADAGGAAVADEVEAELVEVALEVGLLEVVGDDPGARGERGLDPAASRRRPRSTAFFASRPAATMTCGLEVFVQLVMAAMTTSPSVRRWCGAACGRRGGRARRPVQCHAEGVAGHRRVRPGPGAATVRPVRARRRRGART